MTSENDTPWRRYLALVQHTLLDHGTPNAFAAGFETEHQRLHREGICHFAPFHAVDDIPRRTFEQVLAEENAWARRCGLVARG